VRIVPERPDFRLVVLHSDNTRPDACCLRRGGCEEMTVLVARQEGWTGPITLSAEGLPPGVTCLPQTIGPNLRQRSLVFHPSPDAPDWAGRIAVKGTAPINGQPVVREARAGGLVWPPPYSEVLPLNIPSIGRLAREVVLAVREQPAFTVTARIVTPPAFVGH